MARRSGNGRLEERLRDYPYKGCRLRRHQWSDEGMFSHRDGRQTFVVLSFQCMTCGTYRDDFYTTKGEFAYREYTYADGYRIRYQKGDERITTRTVASYLVRNTNVTDDYKTARLHRDRE